MILADTCIWIDFLRGKEPYFSEMSEYLEKGQVLGIEVVFAELVQGARNKYEREASSLLWTEDEKLLGICKKRDVYKKP